MVSKIRRPPMPPNAQAKPSNTILTISSTSVQTNLEGPEVVRDRF